MLIWWRSFTRKEKIYLRLALMPFIFLSIILFLHLISHNIDNSCHFCSASREKGIIKEDVIRFHVLAHSNSLTDQRLKNMVRDVTIQYLSPLISFDATREEVELLLQREKDNLAEVAQQKLWLKGHQQEVKGFFQSIFFPTRLYGGKVYPTGEYKALQLIIGEGAGENWWCVLFPPLCIAELVLIRWEREPLVRWTEGKGEAEKIEQEKKENEVEEEKGKEGGNKQGIERRFKIAEIFRNLW